MDKSAYTIDEFCADNGGMSVSSFYRLVHQGKGPRLMKVGYRTFITAEASKEWREQMESSTAQAKSEACKK